MVKNSVKTLFLMLKHAFNIAWEFLLYDLKGYDSAFSFADPPSLAISHLQYALVEISKNPNKDTLSKFSYIGFRRQELERILGFSMLTETERQQLKKLDEQMTRANACQIADNEQSETPQEQSKQTAESETKDQILVATLSLLAETNQKAFIFCLLCHF